MKKQLRLILAFWLTFFSLGNFCIVQSQVPCNDAISPFFQRYQNGKVGFVNKFGNFVIPPEFDNTFSYFVGDLTAASIDKLWGFIDRKGSWLVKPKYQRVIDITENLLIVIEDGKYKILDRKSESVIASFDEISDFRGELASIRVAKKWGFIDLRGKVVIEPQFDDAGGFSEGLANVKKNGKTFYINKSGETILQLGANVSVGGIFKEGLALIVVNNRYGFIDIKGNIVIKPEFKDVSYQFNEGFARFCENEKCGFINREGEKVISAQFDYVEEFTEGLAHVELNGKNGFINSSGEIIIPIKYDKVGTFECGVAQVEIDKKWAFINKKDKFVFSPRSLK